MFLLPVRPLRGPISHLPAQLSGFVFAVLLSAASLPAQDSATVKTSDTNAPQEAKVTANRPVLPTDPGPLPQKEIYRRLLRGTAYILTLDKEGKPQSSGSGWLLDKERKLLVTNHHVIESLRTLKVYFPRYANDRPIAEKEAYWKTEGTSAEILLADAKKDLAVLRLAEVPKTAEAVILADESPSPGELVYSIGSPATSAALWIFTTGTVRSVHHVKNEDFDGTIIETQSPTNPGDSGGPAVNDRMQLVGVVFSHTIAARLSSNFVDLSEVKKFVERANRVYEPKTADLFVERGVNAKENKRLGAAIADFTSALKLQPNNAAALVRRADCFREQRDFQTALSDYNEAIAADPKLTTAFTGRAFAYRAEKKFDDALTDATTAIRLRPDYYYPLYVRGLINLSRQDPTSAQADFDRSLKLVENLPAANHLAAKHQILSDRARAHETNGDYKAASDDYLAAWEMKPADTALYRRLGDMLLDKAKEPQAAYLVASTMLRRDPNNFDALMHRGRALVALKNLDDGLRDLTAAIRAADGNVQKGQALLQRGIVHDNRGEFKLAASDYLDSIEANGDNFVPFSNLANLMLFKAKDAGAAIHFFTEILKLQPKSPYAYRERGRAYRALNQPDKAIGDFDEALKLNPKLALSHNYRGDFYNDRRDYEAAIRDYNAAVRLNDTEPLFHSDLAIALAGQGDLRAAVKSLDAAIKLNPKFIDAYVNRAIARFRLNDEAGSRADMQKAGDLDPRLKGQEVKHRYSNYLRVANTTSEPLQLYVLYYTPTTSGTLQWYPTLPGPDASPLRIRLEPGEKVFLIDNNYKDQNVKGARFRIWAFGINTDRVFDEYRDTDLVAVSKDGYFSGEYGITDYTFR